MKNKIFFGICLAILIGFIGYYGFYVYQSRRVAGYWCHYNATGSLVISLKNGYTSADKKTIEDYLKQLKGLKSYDFIAKEELTAQGEAYDSFFAYYDNSSGLGEAVSEIKKFAGVKSVVPNNIKSDLEMYYFAHNQYDYYHIVVTKPTFKGSYQYFKGAITLDSKQKLYLNKDRLCSDQQCQVVFTKTNKLCE